MGRDDGNVQFLRYACMYVYTHSYVHIYICTHAYVHIYFKFFIMNKYCLLIQDKTKLTNKPYL